VRQLERVLVNGSGSKLLTGRRCLTQDVKVAMSTKNFYFSRKRLVFIALVFISIGSSPVFFGSSGNYAYGSIMNLGGNSVFGYVLFGLSILIGLYYIALLSLSICGYPAIVVSSEKIIINRLPSKVIIFQDIHDMSFHAGSVKFELVGGGVTWVNLKIVRESYDCFLSMKNGIATNHHA
jgi:hypothetical protein